MGSIRADSGGAWNRLSREAGRIRWRQPQTEAAADTPQNTGPSAVRVCPHCMSTPSLANALLRFGIVCWDARLD